MIDSSYSKIVYTDSKIRLLVQQLAELNSLAFEIHGSQDLPAALERIVKMAMELLDAPGGCLYIANPETEEVHSMFEFSEAADKYKYVTLKYGEGAGGYVAKTREPLIIEDYRVWHNRSPKFGEDYPYRSVLSVPMIWKNSVMGVLQVLDNQVVGRFHKEDLELLSFFAGQAAAVIYNAGIIDTEHRQRELAVKLVETATSLTSSLDINQVLQNLLSQLAQVVPFDSASVMLVEEGQLKLVAQQGLSLAEDEPFPTFPLDDPLFKEIKEQKLPVILKDASIDKRFHGWLGTNRVRGWMGIPLISRGEVIGYITLDSHQYAAYQKLQADWASAFAQQAAIAIENARLFREREQRANDLEALRQASLSVTSNLELEKVFYSILQSTIDLLPDVRNTHIFLYSPEDGGKIKFGAALWKDGRRGEPVAIPRPNGITYQVARSGKTISVSDMRTHPLFKDMPSNWQGAIIGLPLKIGNRVVGVMNVSFPSPRTFPETELRLLGFLSDQAAIAIENANLYTQLENEKRNLSVLYAISRELATTLEPDEIFARSIKLATEALGGYFGLAFRYIAEQDTLSLRAYSGYSRVSVDEYNRTYSWDSGKGFVGWIIKKRQGDIIPDVNQDQRWYFVKGMDEGIQSAMGAPILFEDQLMGLLIIMHQDPGAFQQDDLNLMQAICQETGLALSNAFRYQEVQRRLQQVTLLQKLAQTFSQRLDVQSLLQAVVDELAHRFNYPIVEIYLVRDDFIELRASHGNIPPVRSLPKHRGLIGKAILSGSLQLALDVTAEKEYCPDNPATVSELVVPIMHEDKVAGVINIEAERSGQLVLDDFDFYQLLADQLSIALENATLYESVHRHAIELEDAVAQRTAELSELYELSQKIGYASSYEDLIQILIKHLRSAVQCDFALGCVHANSSSQLIVDSQRPLAPVMAEELSAHCLSLMRSLFGEKVKIAKVQINLAQEYQSQPLLKKFQTIASIPILVKGKAVGMVGVGSEVSAEFSDEQQRLLQTFANQAAIALERLETARQEEKKRLSSIVENLPIGMLLLDHDYHLLVLNPLADQQLKDLNAVIENDILKRLGNVRIEEIIRQRNRSLPLEIYSPGTPRRTFEVQAYAIGESPAQWVLTLREVTQERESQMRIQMQERLATVGQLAAGIAHDFNNIMAAILVYADLLKSEPALSQSSQERLSIIQQQVQRAASLIRQILDFSRRSIMEQSALDLLPFIKEFEKMLRRVMPETIAVELRYKPGRFMVNADPTRMQQVLMNLALNSRDAMPEGGTIGITLDRISLKPGDPLPSEYIQPGEWITLSVRDTGCGIQPEHLPHIFEPFFTTKPIGLGTGLGLAQVYGIVKQHGGYIDVESKPGKGTLFTIYLPVLADPANPTEDESPAPRLDGSGITVLLVEDDDATRQALKTLLDVQQYTVLTARDGSSALAIWQNSPQPIDLIISDVVMPRMGGVELYQHIQKDHPQVKMLLITGHPIKEDSQAILEEKSVHWLQKPFSIQEFNQALLQLIQ